MNKSATIHVGSGMTRSISSGTTRFLGHLQCTNKATTCEAGGNFMESIQRKLDNLISYQSGGGGGGGKRGIHIMDVQEIFGSFLPFYHGC